MMHSGGFRPVAVSEKLPETEGRSAAAGDGNVSMNVNDNSSCNSNSNSKAASEEAWLHRVFPSGCTHALTFSMELQDNAGLRVVRYVAFITAAPSANNTGSHDEVLEEPQDGPLVCYIHASSAIAASSRHAFAALLDFVTELGCEDVFLAMDKPDGALPDEALRVYRYLNFELVHPRNHKVDNALLLRYQM